MSWYSELALTVSLIGFFVVVVSFGILAPWYKTRTGVVLFGIKVNMLLILMLITAKLQLDLTAWGLEFTRAVVYTATAINSIALAYVIIMAQIQGNRQRKLDRLLFTKQLGDPDTAPQDVPDRKDTQS